MLRIPHCLDNRLTVNFEILSELKSVALDHAQTIGLLAELSPLVGEVRECRVVSATNSHGRILGFLDRILFYQVAPHLYSRG
jgi:hypothetical protein